MEQKTTPIWGYRRDEQRLFQLREGEHLPAGWYNSAAKAASRPSIDLPAGEPAPLEPAPKGETLPLSNPPSEPADPEEQPKKRRGRPPKFHEHDEEPGAELASELRDE
jgi:hypothetical protein